MEETVNKIELYKFFAMEMIYRDVVMEELKNTDDFINSNEYVFFDFVNRVYKLYRR